MGLTEQKESRQRAYSDIKQAEGLSETEFSKLFHEARTTTPDKLRTNGYSGVSVPVNFSEDSDEYEVGKVVKTRQGEHFHVRNTTRWNSVISLPVIPFMETRTAKNEIVRQIQNNFSF